MMIVGFLLEKLKLSLFLNVAYLKGWKALKGSIHLSNFVVRRTNLVGMNCVQQLCTLLDFTFILAGWHEVRDDHNGNAWGCSYPKRNGGKLRNGVCRSNKIDAPSPPSQSLAPTSALLFFTCTLLLVSIDSIFAGLAVDDEDSSALTERSE